MKHSFVTKRRLIDKKTRKCFVCNETIKYCKCIEMYQTKINRTESKHDLFYGNEFPSFYELATSKENNYDI